MMRWVRLAIPFLFFSAVPPLFAATDPGYFGLSPRDRQTVGLEMPDLQINSFNGNLTATRSLFLMPGRGLPLECYLVYNSDHRAVSSPFGMGWLFSYHIRYLRHGNGDITIAWGNGRQDRFTATPRSAGGFTAPNGVYLSLSEPLPGNLELRDKRGICFLFEDASHQKLTAIRDPNGNQISLIYQGSGRLRQILDAGGRSMRLFYDGGPLLRRLRDESLNREYSFTYDGLHRLTAINDPLGQSTQFSYDTENLLTGITDKRGHSAAIGYTTPAHHLGTRLPATIVKDVSTTSFTYDQINRRTTVTDARGQDWRYEYDAMGRAVGLRDPDLKSIDLGWDAANNLTSVTDRNGHAHTFSYDAVGNRLSHTDPLAQTRTWTYDPVYSRILSHTNRNADTWNFQYDAKGNLIEITDPLTNQTAIAHDGFGQPLTSTNPALETTAYIHDGNGNMTSITDPLGGVRTHVYDAASRQIQTTDANGNTRVTSYDAVDRIGSLTNPFGGQTTFTYDGENNLSMLTNPRGFSTSFTYDALGRRTAAQDALGNSETYAYDPMGNRTGITDRRGNTTLFSYDSIGRLTERTTPRGKTWRYGYDCERNPTSRLDPLGRTTTLSYDGIGRILSRTLPGPRITTYSYDGNGNLTGASQPGSTLTFTYDAINRMTSQTDVGLAKTLTLTYDANGNLLHAIRPDGDTQIHEYDIGDRITRITADGQQFDFAHDPGGRRTQLARPGLLTTDYSYDAINRIVLQETTDGVDTISHSFAYSSDQLSETREDGTVHTMTFDALDRMARDVRGGSPAYDFIYSFDANGNITGNTGTTPFFPNDPLSFTYDADNQVVTEAGTDFGGAYTRTYSYDDNGNLVQKLGVGISTVSYVYDELNRLVSATDSGVGSENYTYDALGRLQSIQVPAPAAGEFAFQRFFYDQDGNIILNYDMAGSIQEQYWHNHGRGTVLFSTLGDIQPHFHTVIQTFPDSGLGGFDTLAADDFTVPDSGWAIETIGMPKYQSSTVDRNVSSLARELPVSVDLLDALRRIRGNGLGGKPVRVPKPPKEGQLLGYPGYLGNKILPLPPEHPRYDYPRPPDGYLLRKVGLILFFILQDAYGNNNAGVTGGLAGLAIQVYDLLKRIIVFGNPGPMGPGGNVFYRARINSFLSLSGQACENYTSFRYNQPVPKDLFDTGPLDVDQVRFSGPTGHSVGQYYFDEFESFR